MSVVVVSGTGTGIGKTVVTAAVAALAHAGGRRVAVVKAAQTGLGPGEPGDLDDVARLAALPASALHEPYRYPDPLSPEAAARHAGLAEVDLRVVADLARDLARTHDLVLVEGAGGLAVRFDAAGATVADLAATLRAPVLLVADPALGTLSTTSLTLEAMRHRGLALHALVLGSWPDVPDLAMRSNLRDLRTLTGQPLGGVLPAGAGSLDPAAFLAAARAGLSPLLGGDLDAADFTSLHDPAPEGTP